MSEKTISKKIICTSVNKDRLGTIMELKSPKYTRLGGFNFDVKVIIKADSYYAEEFKFLKEDVNARVTIEYFNDGQTTNHHHSKVIKDKGE